MSSIIEKYIICDGKRGKCGKRFGTGDKSVTIFRQHLRSRLKGWCYKDGYDYCPECKNLYFWKGREMVH